MLDDTIWDLNLGKTLRNLLIQELNNIAMEELNRNKWFVDFTSAEPNNVPNTLKTAMSYITYLNKPAKWYLFRFDVIKKEEIMNFITKYNEQF